VAERTEAPDVPVYDARRAEATRARIFLYDIAMFILLVVLAWAYFYPTVMLKNLVPPELQGVPVFAFWFGALGGIVISLKGIYDHSPRDWQMTYNLWHYGRPFSGGIAGSVTYLLLLAVSGSAPSQAITLAAAFIIGTQERRFFNFLSEVARLIVQVQGDPQDEIIEVREVRSSVAASNQPRPPGSAPQSSTTPW
jgi:hypothetical protein